MQVLLSDKELPTSKIHFAPQPNANQQQQKKPTNIDHVPLRMTC